MEPYKGHDWWARSWIANDLYRAWNRKVPGWAMGSDMVPHRVRLFRLGGCRLFK